MLTNPSEIERWRLDEVQAIGAAISTRNWHSLETAYNQLRDKMDRALISLAKQQREPAPDASEVAGAVELVERVARAIHGAIATDPEQTSFVETLWPECRLARLAQARAAIAAIAVLHPGSFDGSAGSLARGDGGSFPSRLSL